MIFSVLSRISALVLLIAGITLLFAPDVVLPAVVPGFPTAAAWLGQLLAGAWLGVAALNWLQRSTSSRWLLAGYWQWRMARFYCAGRSGFRSIPPANIPSKRTASPPLNSSVRPTHLTSTQARRSKRPPKSTADGSFTDPSSSRLEIIG